MPADFFWFQTGKSALLFCLTTIGDKKYREQGIVGMQKSCHLCISNKIIQTISHKQLVLVISPVILNEGFF
jgi:hypothetical protein